MVSKEPSHRRRLHRPRAAPGQGKGRWPCCWPCSQGLKHQKKKPLKNGVTSDASMGLGHEGSLGLLLLLPETNFTAKWRVGWLSKALCFDTEHGASSSTPTALRGLLKPHVGICMGLAAGEPQNAPKPHPPAGRTQRRIPVRSQGSGGPELKPAWTKAPVTPCTCLLNATRARGRPHPAPVPHSGALAEGSHKQSGAGARYPWPEGRPSVSPLCRDG